MNSILDQLSSNNESVIRSLLIERSKLYARTLEGKKSNAGVPIVELYDKSGDLLILSAPISNRNESVEEAKDNAMKLLSRVVELSLTTTVIAINDSWILDLENLSEEERRRMNQIYLQLGSLEHHPKRKECIFVNFERNDGNVATLSQIFHKTKDNKVVFDGEPKFRSNFSGQAFASSGRMTNYFKQRGKLSFKLEKTAQKIAKQKSKDQSNINIISIEPYLKKSKNK